PSIPAVDPFAGQLQAMTVGGQSGFSTETMNAGESIEIGWVNVAPETAHADALAAGAAIVNRGEGIWWFEGAAYFTATSNGQVFRLAPDGDHQGGTLSLVADSLDMPDNITVAPWGALFVAEDNSRVNHIRMVDAS